MTVYGIPNCDTVKKALDWLKANHVAYEFHDFKKLGVSAAKLKQWNKKAGYEAFMNRRSIAWKQLDPAIQQGVKTAADAFGVLEQNTSMIKRPVIEDGKFLHFGFDEAIYRKHFLG